VARERGLGKNAGYPLSFQFEGQGFSLPDSYVVEREIASAAKESLPVSDAFPMPDNEDGCTDPLLGQITSP
jgi:hypothetical protein